MGIIYYLFSIKKLDTGISYNYYINRFDKRFA